MQFRGRTIQVVKDFSVDEQWYLYQKTRELKQELQSGASASVYSLGDSETALYLLFLEDSTRTKESFRNAGMFHGLKVIDFNAGNSSVQKKENLTDTVKMLIGYSKRSVFVFRTRQEGVCRWLDTAMERYSSRMGIQRPVFINAGDGRHEHPTQEFLDEFSFLEHRRWDRSSIHIALVGDLFHGRTAHSKVDGLRVFDKVKVDLIAPAELAMPGHYVQRMKDAGYEVRNFSSIDDYLLQKNVAPIWYFTRLQLERMGESVLKQLDLLRRAVTFRKDFMPLLPPNSRFFHPLPRHSEMPTIPSFLDETELNGWDEQSRNGYYTRIIEIGMLLGHIGADFTGLHPQPTVFDERFIEEAPLRTTSKVDYKVGIRPVSDGIVIDHIGTGDSPGQIWDHIHKIRKLLNLDMVSSQGVYTSENKRHYKGIISIPDLFDLDEKKLKMLAAIAPNCTLNSVQASKVVKKYRLRMPPRVYKLEGLKCRNEDCISNPKFFEPVFPEFDRNDEGLFVCKYCETPHKFQEIWGS